MRTLLSSASSSVHMHKISHRHLACGFCTRRCESWKQIKALSKRHEYGQIRRTSCQEGQRCGSQTLKFRCQNVGRSHCVNRSLAWQIAAWLQGSIDFSESWLVARAPTSQCSKYQSCNIIATRVLSDCYINTYYRAIRSMITTKLLKSPRH